MTRLGKPLVMGAGMGAMMLWMAHGMMTGESSLSGLALVGFVGVHLALIAVIAVAGVFAARLSPRSRAFVARLHRPNLHHIAMMMTGAIGVAALTHLAIHGGIV